MSNLKIAIANLARIIYKYKNMREKYLILMTVYLSFVCYTVWFKKMDTISYFYISWTIHDMWMIYITFERGGPKFSNTAARALA